MNLSPLLLCAMIPPLLLLEGFFSGSEIALFSADRLLLRKRARAGSRGAALALDLAKHPERILSTTLLMTSLCVIGISSLMAIYFLEGGRAHGDLLAVAVTSPLVVLVGELIPKTLYQMRATTLAPWVARPVTVAYWVCYPATRLLSSYTTRLSRLAGPIEDLLSGRRRTTREEIRSLLSYGKRETEIKTSQKKMIRRIFDFKDTEAKHALIPLVSVEAIEQGASVKEALERFENHRHSRMPVYSDRVDNIVGVLEAADLFSAADLEQPIRHYVTPARFAAESQSLEDLLLDMRREDDELAVVVDEHGGAVGILTFEDIVEEIVGEIQDEDDSGPTPYKDLGAGSWLVQAKMEIPLLNEQLGLELPQGEYETLSGFLLQQFGRIPEPKDELYFTTPAGALKFTIRKASDRHIESVQIDREDQAKPSPES